MSLFKKKNPAKKSGADLKPHTTAQQTVPYHAAYKNGIIETEPGVFSKTYLIGDIDFKTAELERQESLFKAFGVLINTYGDMNPQFSVVNTAIDDDEFASKHLLKLKNDDLNLYREELNNIMLSRVAKGNGIRGQKYLTLTAEAPNIDEATNIFRNTEGMLNDAMKNIGGATVTPLGFDERIKLLHILCNPLTKDPFSVSFDDLAAQHKSSKDAVTADAFKVNRETLEINDKISATLFLDVYPSSLSTDFMSGLNELPFTLTTAVHYESVQQDKALKMIRDQVVNINTSISEQQRKASRQGYSIDLVSPDLEAAKNDAEDLLTDIKSRDQRLFYVTVTITIYANDKAELDAYIKMAQTAAQKHLCVLRKLMYQQEYGFASTLPLGVNKLSVKRLLTTEASCLFMPFSTQELIQEGGLYYGVNSVSGNIILYNRALGKNANGLVLGTSGAGKSFAVKREILSVLLGTNSDAFVVDPEREYTALAKALNGEVIRIAAGGEAHINPFDLNMKFADDDDPLTLKSDYICSLCEVIMGMKYGLDPLQKSIIDRCVRLVYKEYIQYMHEHPELDIAPEKCPTLVDFYNCVMEQEEIEAHNLALAIEIYCTGTMNMFAFHTNVNFNNRFVVYDIKDIGTTMKALGLQVCLQDIWNRTITNKSRGVKTWSWFDEFHIIAQSDTAMQFMRQFWKRARKWGGVPTGITQNVEDLLVSTEARTLISNSEYIMLLNQSAIDREELSGLLHISSYLQQFITDVSYGRGLMYTGKSIVPFMDEFPKTTETYKLLSTHPDET